MRGDGVDVSGVESPDDTITDNGAEEGGVCEQATPARQA
jgi:hypothetical protein